MQKYKAKFDTPWCKKGEIFERRDRNGLMFYGGKDRSHLDDFCTSPENYPNLFEPVGDWNNRNKWLNTLNRIALREIYNPKNRDKTMALIRNEVLEVTAELLDVHGYDADRIYREVCCEDKD